MDRGGGRRGDPVNNTDLSSACFWTDPDDTHAAVRAGTRTNERTVSTDHVTTQQLQYVF